MDENNEKPPEADPRVFLFQFITLSLFNINFIQMPDIIYIFLDSSV